MAEPLNVSVNDGGAMYAHEMSVNFTPTQFFLDFKMITPRTDPRGQGRPNILLQHNVVMVEPWHVKKIIEVLENSLKRYEDEYGKITKPKPLAKAEKKQKKAVDAGKEKEATPNYMG
jgi:hypothetical protein